MRDWKCQLAATLLATAAFAGTLGPVHAADHRDAPGIDEDVRADLNDVYAFVNPNNGNVVLAMTVNPFIVPGAPGVGFSPNVLYQFKIDNTGDAVEDMVVQARFTDIPNQIATVSVQRADPPRSRRPTLGDQAPVVPAVTVTGPANGTVFSSNGLRVFGGVRDDPFFFDLVFVFRFLGIQPGGPLTRAPGIDFFAGINISAFEVELPPALLRGSTGNTIRVWGTTSRDGVQVDRMGLPAINTVLIPFALKDDFNHGVPSADRRVFRSTALATLIAVNGNSSYSNQLVDALLPDVLTLDMTSTAGFLNGRRPQDDVIDGVLRLASNQAVQGDGVNANDVAFLADFPFLAPPHQPTETIPPRN